MSPPSGTDQTRTDSLAERVALGADVSDGCHRVLEALLRAGDASRALVAVRAEGELHIESFGLRSTLSASHSGEGQALRTALEEAIDTAESGVTAGERWAPELSGVRFRWVTFPGPRGVPSGVAAVEGEEPLDEELVVEIRRAGPVLARIYRTERLERELEDGHKQAALLSTVVDALLDPVVLTDERNSFLYANRRAEQLFSAQSQDSEGKRRAVQVNDLLFSSFLTQSVIADAPSSRELNLVDPQDGSDLLFEVISTPLPADMKREGVVISVLRDISDLKRALTELETQFSRSRVAEQAARRESDRLNVILGNVGDPILVTDGASKIILMNAEADRLFDTGATEARGQQGSRVRAVQANDTKFTTLISDFLLQSSGRRVENLVLTDPASNEELPIEVVSSKITDRHGDVTAIVSILHDLTQVVENERLARELRALNEGLEERIRLATEELEERNRRLEWQSAEVRKASRLKSQFLANMSHELRTPINAMLGYAALMKEEIYGPLTDGQETALQKIQNASQHLLAIINDILDLSKIEAGHMPVLVEEVEIGEVILEVAQTIEPLVRDKPVELGTEIDPHLPVMQTDRTKVKQIVLNLLSNAVKFTQEGHVLVRARPEQDGERVSLEVVDTGIGIPAEHQSSIFEDFRQADQSATRKHGGTGLGLSITRRLTELMGGSISLVSELGEGSTFRVLLPTVTDVEGTAGAIQRNEVPPDAGQDAVRARPEDGADPGDDPSGGRGPRAAQG